ncbi:uncharacterized protein LOC131242159 [Magnolia sinica]|uniref:uncharacterized protein LOC131242159 n=1 Tax=Magnolia sinica TaxID=86752 RepID=UPI0026596316|nr:uncharacterized protein LOC131242159 [Magnolia sinica]XP_058096594.1 uncharacterized protein LOC131242159 [Magnolia sinica]XP_058096595.1 uncharacterized protein LOC131242159 [Magnolia sinica]XP_058096596.1 uncharacterized protein LOC131242159 [Magnolia sinica]
MGGVFLGMPGPWAEDNYEASDHYTTKIGGLPDWPFPESDIRPDLLECGVCGGRLCLVAQVYAPIAMDSLKVEDRTIYILGCAMTKCGSSPLSWRTLRVQKPHSEVEASPAGQKASASSEVVKNSNKWWEEGWWTVGNDDGDDGDVDLEELARALSEAGSLASHSKKQNGHALSDTVAKVSPMKSSIRVKDASIPVVPCFYIYSQEEQSSDDLSSVCANYSSLTIKGNKSSLDDDDGEGELWEAEGYEYDRALDADRTYLKFKKRMDVYPEQCFRYSYGGKPLIATTNLGEPSTCGVCGRSRHYEMQLMPPLLYFLRQAADDSSTHSPDDWNWMTLIIYTCTNSCSLPLPENGTNSNGWSVVEEATIIQHEKSLHGSARLTYFT